MYQDTNGNIQNMTDVAVRSSATVEDLPNAFSQDNKKHILMFVGLNK